MEIHEALEDIAIAFRQLEFAVKLLSFIAADASVQNVLRHIADWKPPPK
jgi:hypothetical protein